MAEGQDDVQRKATEATDRLLQCILDPEQFAPDGIVQEFKSLSPAIRDILFPLENGRSSLPARVRDLLPAACETGNLETVIWLLFFGVNPHVKSQRGTPLEVATFYGHSEIVEKLIDCNEDILGDQGVVIACLMKACEGQHNALIKVWLGHLNNICFYQPPWSNFTRISPENSVINGFSLRVPKNIIQQLPEEIVQALGQSIQRILEVWVVSDDEEDDDERLRALWRNRKLQSFEENWLQRPRYNANLVSIDLSHNALQTLPRLLLWGMPWLKYLDLSDNAIVALPDSGQYDPEKSGLKTLKLTNNNLNVVPSEVFMMPQLELLLLARNRILTIGQDQQEDDDEARLNWKCPNLQELNVSFNELTTIPYSISAACGMRRLDVSNNKLTTTLTPWHCPMEALNLSSNQISTFQDIHIFWGKTLKVLHLGSNNLEHIPPSICRLTMLENLNLSNTHIGELPDKEMWKTFSLSKLDLSYNHLTNNIKTTTRRHFRFSSNNHERRVSKDLEFPDFFNTKLKELNLSFNDLHSVPRCVCNMRALQCLDLQGIKELKDHLASKGYPSNLVEKEIQKAIFIPRNTYISSLPNDMAILRDLSRLRVDPDQISKLNAGILQQDRPRSEKDITQTVMKRLRNRFLEFETCKDIKITLIGPPQSGKTELRSCLTGCGWPYRDSGVNVKRTTFDIRRKHERLQEIFFTVWDLKGGEDFLVIHQAFLTSRTIYLLVWDIRERGDESLKRLEPYILNIQARAPSCPIIAVATHVDKFASDLRERVVRDSRHAFMRNFPEVNVSFVEVDARPGSVDGTRNLKLLIYNCATTLTYKRETRGGREGRRLIDRNVPRSFIQLKEKLIKELEENQEADFDEHEQRNNVPILTEADAIKKIQDLGIPIETSDEVEEVVDFLQDCGVLLHVRDYTYRLTRLYFLDPAWLSDTLVKVIRLKNDNSTMNAGIVGESRLRNLCKASGFGEERFKEYIQLLARFEIALSTNRHRPGSPTLHEAQSYVIPAALPRGPPCIEHIGETPYRYKLMRWYRMAYTPPGFWSRLMARLLVSIKQHSQNPFSIRLEHVQTYVSQEAMYIHHENGQIKIEPMLFPRALDREDPGLRITILSKNGTFAPLGFVVDHIEKLIKEWYPGLTKNRQDGSPSVAKLVPCPMCDHSLQNNQYSSAGTGQIQEIDRYHLFPLEEIIQAICLRGRECIECPRHPNRQVSLKRLAPDLFLTDLAVEHLRMDELILDQVQLGKGSFGDVHAAKYCGRSVAVKILLRNKENDHQNQLSTSSSSSSSTPPVSGTHSLVSLHETDTTTSDTLKAASVAARSPTADILQSIITIFPRLRYEVRMMSRLNHPCVLQLVGVSIHHLCLAVELASKGDLASYVSEVYKERRDSFVRAAVVHEPVLPRLLSFKIAFQLASVIDYLHNLGIIHADIKTNNVLLFSTDIQSSINIKLSDYGISQELDIGGVRGNTGRHAFCAPEITKGLAFDEKIDWFSFAMFLYHIVTGTLPFMNTTSLDTIAHITTGSRPEFQYYNYSMRPQLPHMVGLMEACWQENPDKRPSGKEVLTIMRDTSFMCLRRSGRLESDTDSLFYTDVYQCKTEVQASHVYVWHSDGHVMDHDMYTGDVGKVIRVAHQDGGQVFCGLAFDGIHVMGTSDRTIDIYSLIKHRLVLQKRLDVPSDPTTLYYTHTKKASMTSDHAPSPGLLYVGLYYGEIVMYKHQPQVDIAIGEWTKVKTLTLSVDPAPCLCIEPAKERNEVWVSCGTTLRVLNTSDGLLDPTVISVSSGENQLVKGLCYSDGSIWCFVDGSHQIIRYDAASRQLKDSFNCGNSLQRPGSCLTSLLAAVESGSSSSEMDKETKHLFFNPHLPKQVIDSEEFDHLASQSAPQFSYLPVEYNDNNDDRFTLSESHLTSEENVQVKVSSISIVQDTLWVGREQGNILVVYVGLKKPSQYQFGEVLAVLTANPILGLPKGPTKQLLHLGCNRVVERQHVDHPRGGRRPFRHLLLIWENWGSQEIAAAKVFAAIPGLKSDL